MRGDDSVHGAVAPESIALSTMPSTNTYNVESWGTYEGDWFKSALFVFCEENDRIAELGPGQTARVWFKSGAGRSLLWVERIA